MQLQAYENASKLNGNPLAYFAIGGSAGGGIALSVTEKLIRNGKRSLVQGVVALNPITTHVDNPPAKYKDIYKSYSENATNVPLVDRHCMDVSFGELPSDVQNANTRKVFHC
jgi:versiconal hemiacetal acetate esterase